MRRLVAACAMVTILAGIPQQASAGDGVALGLLGGLAAGTIIGSVASQPRVYYEPVPMEVGMEEPPPPVIMQRCYWARGAPEWDEYRGVWVRPRIQVCD